MRCARLNNLLRIFTLTLIMCKVGYARPVTAQQPDSNHKGPITVPFSRGILVASTSAPEPIGNSTSVPSRPLDSGDDSVATGATEDLVEEPSNNITGSSDLTNQSPTGGKEQSSSDNSGSPAKLIKFSGNIPNRSAALMEMTFSLYQRPEGGTAIWQETQPVQVDSNGRYTVFLGAYHSDGIAASLFRTDESRWLGVTPSGMEELPRVLLVSVPYAMKAADADTLGGLPASAFQRVDQTNSVNTEVSPEDAGLQDSTNIAHDPTPIASSRNFLPVFADKNGGISASTIYQPVPGMIGINTTHPTSTFHVLSQIPAVANFQRLNGAQFKIGSYPESYSAFNGAVVSISDPTSSQYRPLVFDVKWFEVRINGDNTKSFYMAPDGKMGVGTTVPTEPFTVNGNIQILKGGLLFPDGSIQTSAATSNGGVAAFAMINAPNVFSQPQTMPAGLGGLPSPVNPSDAATKAYTDTSGMVNIKSLGCKGDGVSDDTACIQAMATNLSNTTYFFPAGKYKLTSCVSIPLATGWHIIGASETGSILLQTSPTCILKFTKELTNNFSIERMQFAYTTPQPAPSNDEVDSVAPAILFAPDTHNGGGVFEFEFAHLLFVNGSRGIDIQKKANGVAVANPVWGFNMHDIIGGRTLQGATVDLVQGKAQGMPRCGFYNIYNAQTILEPQISVRYCNSLDFRNIESNNAQNRVYDLTSNYGGTVSGLHIEAHTLLTSNISIITAENSDLIFMQVDLSSHLCPSGAACKAFSLISNTAGGGSIDVEGAYLYLYSGSSAGVMSYVLNTSGNSSITTARVLTSRGFTADYGPGSITTPSVREILRPLEGRPWRNAGEGSSGTSIGSMEPSRKVPNIDFYESTPAQMIQSLAVTLPASRMESRSCSSTVSFPVSGVRSTSLILWSESQDSASTEGDVGGDLDVRAWPSGGNVNFRTCNRSAQSIIMKSRVLNVRILQ